MTSPRTVPPYARSFAACTVIALSFWWALDIAGSEVVVDDTTYGSAVRVAIGADGCDCEDSSEPDPDAPVAQATARRELTLLVAPAGLTLLAAGYLARMARRDLRRRRDAGRHPERARDTTSGMTS